MSLFLFPIAESSRAAEYTYSASQASTLSSKKFAAGDIITLADGDWTNKSISLKGTGNSSKPITVKAQTEGKVILKGSSKLTIEGAYIHVSGLLFEGNSSVGKNHVITFSTSSSYCRLTNSAIRNYNPASSSTWGNTDNKWVSINGTYNRVDHCYFESKGNIGTLLVIWLVKNKSANHQIDNNHFYKRTALLDEDDKELNGQEIIRIGDSSTSMTSANCIIENNFFEECDGEIEIISNKSCNNIYRNNVFYNNNGTLTLRHGDRCEVYGNYFLGNSRGKSGGIRVIGEDHKIYNNYFQDLKGSGYRSAVCLINGKKDAELTGYFQVKNALVAFNTCYNCSNAFTVGFDGGKELAPISSTIVHNVIVASTTSQTGVLISNNESQITWKNNLMYKGKFNNFSPSTNQFVRTTSDLFFEATDQIYGIYQPTTNSVIKNGYLTKEYPEIKTDIRGRIRNPSRMIGAFELNNSPTIELPTPQKIGCSFINKDINDITNQINTSGGGLMNILYYQHKQLIAESQETSLNLRIYNLKGELLDMQTVLSENNKFRFTISNALSGLFILTFDNGKTQESKRFIL